MTDHVWTHCTHCSPGHWRPGEHHAPGLAIVDMTTDHHGDDHEPRWTITHIPSGRAIAYFCCDTHAHWHADDVAELTDWTRSEDDLNRDEDWFTDQLKAFGLGPGVNRCEPCFDAEVPLYG